MPELKLYNTLTRKKQAFKPIKPGLVGLYTCGPTVYNYAHIGNLRCYVFEDILKRVLFFNNLKVNHVMNITDVGHLTSDADTGEDKMEKGAKREGKSVWEISKSYAKSFKDDLHHLNILDPDIWCKATDHIKEQIDWIQKLEKLGYTYKTDDGIYFNTSKFKDYGKLAKLKKEGLKPGARIDLGGKKHKTDFALWKFSPKDQKRQMEWPSPFGKGFPGWHIECSVMATKYLGEHFDIHCGGIDHIPVHHTNEIAQTEAVTKKQWVNFWLHCEFLKFDSTKMAKSGDSFLTLKTFTDKGYNPLDYRYFCLNTHYRIPLTFSWQALDAAKSAFSSLKQRILELKESKNSNKTKSYDLYKKQFAEAINDDLNTPKALGIMWTLIRDQKLGSKEKLDLIFDFDKIFGLNLKDIKKGSIPKDIQSLINERETARKNKDFKKSDQIRHQLKKKGILLEDTSDGVKWRKI